MMDIARERMESGSHRLLVANRGNEFLDYGEQVAWILNSGSNPEKVVGKKQIASALLDRIESLV